MCIRDRTGTIQYDPNLPKRFELAYTGEDGKDHQPVMLHRAVLGSLERFMSVYIEHRGGHGIRPLARPRRARRNPARRVRRPPRARDPSPDVTRKTRSEKTYSLPV